MIAWLNRMYYRLTVCTWRGHDDCRVTRHFVWCGKDLSYG